ncbi:MAG: hypothetical protein Q9183_005625, partial [Haloplaca sp. 2 TL-2023]
MKLRSKLSKFKEKCKEKCQQACGKRQPVDEIGQPKEAKPRRKLVKKTKVEFDVVTKPTPEVAEHPNRACLPPIEKSPLPENPTGPAKGKATTDPSPIANGEASTEVTTCEVALHPPATLSRGPHIQFDDTPPKQPSRASTCPDTPTPASRSTQNTTSTQSSTLIPISFLCELPGAYTFNDNALQHDQLAANTNLGEQKKESRKQEAEHWGVSGIPQPLDIAADKVQTIAADIHQQQQEDPFHDFGMVFPPGPSEAATTRPLGSGMIPNAFDVFERPILNGGHVDAEAAEDVLAKIDNVSGVAHSGVSVLPTRETTFSAGRPKAAEPITVGWDDIKPITDTPCALNYVELERSAAEPVEAHSDTD